MEAFESRLEKVQALTTALQANRDSLVEIAVKDTGFTYRECNMEVDGILKDLKEFETMAETFVSRQPICASGQTVALVLPYNGSIQRQCLVEYCHCFDIHGRKSGTGKVRFTGLRHRSFYGISLPTYLR